MSATAKKFVALLRSKNLKLVLAESCTGGALASAITQVPGVSQTLAGSLVTYRDDQKRRWLGVKASTLRRHTAVSEACTREMHLGSLKAAPEADFAIAVTGYLGPGHADDGLVFVHMGTARRSTTLRLRILPHGKPGPELRERRREILVQKILKAAVVIASRSIK